MKLIIKKITVYLQYNLKNYSCTKFVNNFIRVIWND